MPFSWRFRWKTRQKPVENHGFKAFGGRLEQEKPAISSHWNGELRQGHLSSEMVP